LPITFTPSEPDITTGLEIPITNYDRSKLTIVAVTGVTAMVRDTAAIMEDNGLLYPAGDIQAILSSADITHISNEVPFAEDCPAPDPNQESLYFCSKDEYIKLLETVGTDIVELSGDHFGDWGPEAMLHSLTLYRERNWLTYGGGESLSAGLQPVFIEHNGNKIAFIGCNGKAHKRYATASDTNPGASMCAYDWMELEIARLNEQGYLVIATMQHEEIDSFSPVALQQWDLRRLANAGAVIVSGSQAHHPQSFELIGSSLIHYGLGNLFFDQWYLATYNPEEHINKDKAFIDLHIFYAGSHINTRLITLQFIDNARPRLMTDEERSSFLTEVFRASIWDIQN
ncbi:MAG: CapA family protein, partial [Anaerolineales bacterium]|nr:CapA family protein [Anaerolineales bacterium]